MPYPQNESVLARLATAACYFSPGVMVAADVITIALNHNADPLRQTISGYALGPYGWLEKMGMVLVAISFFFIAANMFKSKKPGRFGLAEVSRGAAGRCRDWIYYAQHF